MGARSSQRSTGSLADAGYVLEGSILRAALDARDPTSRGGPELVATVWETRRGHINGVDVTAQIVVDVWTAATRLTLIDERATPEQVVALLDAFGDELGGALVDRTLPVAQHIGFFQVPITCRIDGSRRVVSTPQRFELVSRLDPAEAQVSEISIDVPEHDLVRSHSAVPTTYETFRFAADHRADNPPIEEEQPR